MSVAFMPKKPAEPLFVDPLASKKNSCLFSSIGNAKSCNNVTELVLERLTSPELTDPTLVVTFKNISGSDLYDKSKNLYYLTQKTIIDLTQKCTTRGFSVRYSPERQDLITYGNNQLIISIPSKNEKGTKSTPSDVISHAQEHLETNTEKLYKEKIEKLSQILSDLYDKNKNLHYLTQKIKTNLIKKRATQGFTFRCSSEPRDLTTCGNNQLIVSIPQKNEKNARSTPSDVISHAQEPLQANTEKLYKDKIEELSQILSANENKFSYNLPFPSLGISHTVKEWIKPQLIENGYEILSTETDLVFSKIDAVQVRIIKALKEQSENTSDSMHKVSFTSPTLAISKKDLEEVFGEEFKISITNDGDSYEITLFRIDILVKKRIQEMNQALKRAPGFRTFGFSTNSYSAYELKCIEDGLKTLGVTFSKTDNEITLVNPNFEIKEAIKLVSPTAATAAIIVLIFLKALW